VTSVHRNWHKLRIKFGLAACSCTGFVSFSQNSYRISDSCTLLLLVTTDSFPSLMTYESRRAFFYNDRRSGR
jgi:hypothetical protein